MANAKVDGKEKLIVSARILAISNSKLERLSEQFGTKKSTLAAELLEAAIDDAWEEISQAKQTTEIWTPEHGDWNHDED